MAQEHKHFMKVDYSIKLSLKKERIDDDYGKYKLIPELPYGLSCSTGQYLLRYDRDKFYGYFLNIKLTKLL